MNTANPSAATADLNPDLTVNQIAQLWPHALPVLHRHGLDACCGGAHPLRMVVERHGLDMDAILAELRETIGPTR